MPLTDENSLQTSMREGAPHRMRNVPKAIALGAIEGRIGYHIRRLQVWIFRDFINSLSPLDIRPAQYSVLTVIAENPGLSQTDLSTTLGIESSRLVRILDVLESRELLTRKRAPNDRRSHALRLTAKGTKLLARAHLLADMHEARLAEKIGPNYEKLLAILNKSCEFTRLP